MRKSPRTPIWPLSAAVLTLLGAACSATDSSSASRGNASFGDPNASAGSGGGAGSGSLVPGKGADAGAPLPPEKHVEENFRAPVATTRFVWSANPDSGRVAQIDAQTYGIRTIEAGNGPKYLAAVPSPVGSTDDLAIVLNTLSDDATLLAQRSGVLSSVSFTVAHGHDAWAISPDGHWAIAWTDAKQIALAAELAHTTDPTRDRTQGFQDVSIVDLTAAVPQATILNVGYRPSALVFAAGAAAAVGAPSAASAAPRAFAVTEDGISVLDLAPAGKSTVEKIVGYGDGPSDEPPGAVLITRDGAHAVVRYEQSADLTLIDLSTSTRTTVTLPAPATDLAMTENGDRAIAVMRDTSQVAVLPIPGVALDPTNFAVLTVTGETVGAVALAPGDAKALLYTTRLPVEHLTLMALADAPTYSVLKLHSPVYAAYATADATHAVVLHGDFSAVNLDAGADAGSPTPARAFSVVPLAEDKPARIEATDAVPQKVALSPSGDRAVVTVRDDAKSVYGVYVAKMPQLAVQRYDLASPPMSVGIVAGAKKAFVAQEHPEGRITFIDLDTDEVRTLTGFELGARVVNGSPQP